MEQTWATLIADKPTKQAGENHYLSNRRDRNLPTEHRLSSVPVNEIRLFPYVTRGNSPHAAGYCGAPAGARSAVLSATRVTAAPSARACVTASYAFRYPAPTSWSAKPGMSVALVSRSVFIWSGVKPGFACSISAAVPETWGVAMLVPLALAYQTASVPSPMRSTAKKVSMKIPVVARAAVIVTPGAVIVGW